jgi:carbonic anhydrase
MTIKERMLLESKAWVAEKLSLDKDYFEHLKRMPTPNILWIGSSDNLISIREVTNTEPGELIVHQNIASQVRGDDISLMATLEHAIEVSQVQYVIVCGHSNCNGIREVIQGKEERPYMRKWLDELFDLYDANAGELELLSEDEKEKRLCELSIKAQILKLSTLDIVQKAWEKGPSPALFGWYLDEASGTIKEIFSMSPNQNLKQVASVV